MPLGPEPVQELQRALMRLRPIDASHRDKLRRLISAPDVAPGEASHKP